MKLVIPGGSGQVGTLLSRAFHAEGHDVVVLARTPTARPWRAVQWDGRTLGDWTGEIDAADVIINLAGRSVNCRYNAANRRAILESRVDSTRVVGEAIAKAARQPRVWLQAGTATIYAHRFDAANDEATGIIGGAEPDAPGSWRHSVRVATEWESALERAEVPRTRKVVLRAAMVMSPDPGGVFDSLRKLAGLGLGGRSGDGRQYVSWVHDEDFLRAIGWLIEHDDIAGPVNVAAPGPLPNADFQRVLRRASGIPFGLPASGWMLRLGTALMGTESELVLKSRRVVPARLLESGFRFRFAGWADAADDLCRRWPKVRRRPKPPG